MAVATAVSQYPTTLALFKESTYATGPANAAAWAAAEGSTAWRVRPIPPCDPDWIAQTAVVDERMGDRIGKHPDHDPINGLRNAEGGAITLVLNGSEQTPAATNQATTNLLHELLKHMLGNGTLGYSSAITTATSATELDLTTATGLDEGQWYWFEDADDAGNLFPVRALTVSGSTATWHVAVPYTPTLSDTCYAALVHHYDQDTLSNPADADASTWSILYEKGSHLWEINGCALQLDGITVERNKPPKLNISAMGSYAKPYGDGAPSAPTWTGTVEGAAGLPVGNNLHFHLQAKGTTTLTDYNLISATFSPGIPKNRKETVTEATSQAQGTAGYSTSPADTTMECQIYIDGTTVQDYWDNKTALQCTLYQRGAQGACWAIHGADVVLMEPPKRASGNDSNLWNVKLEFREDRSLDSTATDLERARSKFTIITG